MSVVKCTDAGMWDKCGLCPHSRAHVDIEDGFGRICTDGWDCPVDRGFVVCEEVANEHPSKGEMA